MISVLYKEKWRLKMSKKYTTKFLVDIQIFPGQSVNFLRKMLFGVYFFFLLVLLV